MVITQPELDPEHVRRLSEVGEARGSTAEEVIADLVDQAYAAESHAQRLKLVSEIRRLQIEEPPEPGVMQAQLAEAHGRPDVP